MSAAWPARRSSRKRPQLRTRLVAAGLLAVAASLLTSGGAAGAKDPFSPKGVWICCGPVVVGQNFVVTAGTSAAFSGVDVASSGAISGPIKGSVDGTKVTIVSTTDNGPFKGTVQTYTGTLSKDGNRMTGRWTWHDTTHPESPGDKWSAVRGTAVTCVKDYGGIGCLELVSPATCAKDYNAAACAKARPHRD
jgi:hypothetical protein